MALQTSLNRSPPATNPPSQLPYYFKTDVHKPSQHLGNVPVTQEAAPISKETPAVAGSSTAPIYVLCIPMHRLSRPLQFTVCVCGIVFFYLLYGYSQEWIFRDETFKVYGWYLTLVQFCCYSAFGFVEQTLHGDTQRRIPLRTYMLVAFLTVATMGLSNTSLGYLNYPTQVIFKSCKLIPVMMGGVLIQGKRYSLLSVVAMVVMCLGLVLFNLADVSVMPNMNHTGIILISLALCADAVIGNVQEKAMKDYSASSVEMVLYSYSIGVLYMLVITIATGSLVTPFYYCLENPRIYLMALVFSLTGYLGVNFVLAMVKSFSALLAVTVTTFRKTITVVLSFLLFTKPFSQQYVWSGLLVLLGIFLNIYSKNSSLSLDWRPLKSRVLHFLEHRTKGTPTLQVLNSSESNDASPMQQLSVPDYTPSLPSQSSKARSVGNLSSDTFQTAPEDFQDISESNHQPIEVKVVPS